MAATTRKTRRERAAEQSTQARQSQQGTEDLQPDEPWYIPGLLALFAVIGIGISIYLTIVHYTKAPLVCQSGVFNCQKVTSSAYSVVWPTTVPITVPGMFWFIVSGALAVWMLLALSGRVEAPPWLPLAHVVWAAAGLAFVFWLVYVEFGLVKAICEWCSGVHILTLLTFILALIQWQRQAVARYAEAG